MAERRQRDPGRSPLIERRRYRRCRSLVRGKIPMAALVAEAAGHIRYTQNESGMSRIDPNQPLEESVHGN